MKWFLCSAAVMLGLPWLGVRFAPGDAGMAICFLLFFAIDPVYSVILGIFSGRRGISAWYQPGLNALLFLAGTWLLFDMAETAFLVYAAAYLGLGYLAMGGVLLWKKLRI